MKKTLQLSLMALCFSLSLTAQQNNPVVLPQNAPQKRCGTELPPKEWDEYFNKEVEKFKQDIISGRRAAASYTIPVIVHVIPGGEAPGTFPNISAAQINSQLNVLNADLGGTGWNVGNLAATAFSAVGAANCQITFCAATKNPLGQTLAEPGIHRVRYQDSSWSNPFSFGSNASLKAYFDGTIKPKTIWDPQYYLNVWTSGISNQVSLLGYATFPAGAALAGLGPVGSANTDGIWVYAGCYGNVGSLMLPTNNLGRTATHEIGHWLGLRHIGGDGDGFGNGDCAATDYCNDTPPQKGGNLGCPNGQNWGAPAYPLHVNDCPPNDPNGDMFMNFMDYCDDGSLIMFTPDQKTRMQTAMATALYRQSLTASSATQCTNPASTPTAYANMPINVCNTVGVISTTAYAIGNPIPTFFWTTTPSAGVTYSPSNLVANPSITFPSAGVYTVNCAATNSVGTGNAATTVSVDACDVGIAKNILLRSYITLQPNPSNGKVNLIMTLPSSMNLNVSVTNILGQTIMSSKHPNISSGSIEIDLTHEAAGVYFINIESGKEKTVKRLILNK